MTLSITFAAWASQALSATTWLIWDRCVAMTGFVVYQVRIVRVVPIGCSSSNTGSIRFWFCSDNRTPAYTTDWYNLPTVH